MRRAVVHGWFYDLVLWPAERARLGELRSELLSAASGRTLEIGAGTGLNLPHYPSGVEVVVTEPDEGMVGRIGKHADRAGLQPIIRIADAQELPFPAGVFDTVVATLVFCTIPHPDRAIREAHRVLKPGGRFLVMEHIRRDTPVAGRLQDAVTPLWKLVAGGCHLNRNPERSFLECGFAVEKTQDLWRGYGRLWILRKCL